MLRFAQKPISIIQDMVFLGGQTADSLQGLHRQKGVPLANLGQVASVEELQELNGKLDIPDAAMPGLDIRLPRAASPGLVFDPAFEGLDLIDFREAQILS